MTCVWNSIIQGIPHQFLTSKNFRQKPRPAEFVEYLKENNVFVRDVKVNNGKLSPKLIDENFEAIKSYDVGSIYTGYLCSTCDPFLILICHLFKCNINHNYLNVLIKYESQNPKFIINLRSTNNHMDLASSEIIRNRNI